MARHKLQMHTAGAGPVACTKQQYCHKTFLRIQVTAGDAVQELEVALQDAHLAESLELLGLTVDGGIGAAVEEGEQGRDVLAGMEGSYRLSMQQVTLTS